MIPFVRSAKNNKSVSEEALLFHGFGLSWKGQRSLA